MWGLFKQALYPYMLCTFDINRVEVADGGYHVPQVRGLEDVGSLGVGAGGLDSS